MKKSAIIFSIFLLLAFTMNNLAVIAAPNPQTFSEGFYTINDLKLMPNVSYKVKNASSGKIFMIIFSGDQLIQQSIRLEPNSIEYTLKPMQYDHKIVVIGNGQLLFST
ncbi:hypothetical protein B0P06_000232 [Clostridium saccharoperbutylacetonicum]|uniref:Uncharacterized protein n=1 Tax=Clostridium saccharoperbutylacetonicum N1-4(HMT) TaxID=931276 RepID=M1LRU1_9CLOT|nr:hypothetical protein [Clostridium saccharoperbutylacetonicum]AGF55660.1 hypothetical protein Cspa_c18900 [Clostridium saccharoperbutylacetonicum N1-4(HMT)]NRT63614.1 hypothetical protein [Clostridium saccharoperbutylacetonicum]NSB26977.1 hypothetical protein [Clostridium saccharoperbutylacetonicum]NSB40461.1 hypothetical protein [Clostridium saccharoperbutylacetonicum]